MTGGTFDTLLSGCFSRSPLSPCLYPSLHLSLSFSLAPLPPVQVTQLVMANGFQLWVLIQWFRYHCDWGHCLTKGLLWTRRLQKWNMSVAPHSLYWICLCVLNNVPILFRGIDWALVKKKIVHYIGKRVPFQTHIKWTSSVSLGLFMSSTERYSSVTLVAAAVSGSSMRKYILFLVFGPF